MRSVARCFAGGETVSAEIHELYVYGGSGFAREVACLVEQAMVGDVAGRTVNGLIDDDRALWGKCFGGLRVVGGEQFLLDFRCDVDVVFGLSTPSVKSRLYAELMASGHIHFPRVVHPTSLIAPTARLGVGVIVFPWVAVWNEVSIGDICLLCTSSHVGHETCVGSFSSIYPKANISGGVDIGQAVTVGVNATILPGLRISRDSYVGASANVTRDVPAGAVVAGNPAREVKGRA
jgi:sugar O-acyltransferase (sialic acid O-acetyltransferase NeuD family)